MYADVEVGVEVDVEVGMWMPCHKRHTGDADELCLLRYPVRPKGRAIGFAEGATGVACRQRAHNLHGGKLDEALRVREGYWGVPRGVGTCGRCG